ncbi:MAG: hypothetical protein HWN68_02190 [Desulfobacterales bacterium]|nr:hypothetical protein [Desulfobacterales bacterium]
MNDEEEEEIKRAARLQTVVNLHKRITALEKEVASLKKDSWSEWARRLIVALIAALLAILGYKGFGL